MPRKISPPAGDLQHAGYLVELVHQIIQLGPVLNADLHPDNGKAILRAAGVQPKTKVLVEDSAAEISNSRFSRSLHTASMVVG